MPGHAYASTPVTDLAESLPYNPEYFTPPSEEKKKSTQRCTAHAKFHHRPAAVGVVEGVAGLLAVGVVALFSTSPKSGTGKPAAKPAGKSGKPAGKSGKPSTQKSRR